MLNSFCRRITTLLQHRKSSGKFGGCMKKKQNENLLGSFDALSSSFSTMEVETQFVQVFKVFDSNGDGKISINELSQVLLRLGKYDEQKAFEEARGMVKEIDRDGDGFLDLAEFMDIVSSEGDEEHGNGRKDCGSLMDAFLIFDEDRNGLISAKELQRVLLQLGCEKCSMKECMLMIKGVDKNGDEFVDFEEFRMMMMMEMPRSGPLL